MAMPWKLKCKILEYELEAYSVRMVFIEEEDTKQADRWEQKKVCPHLLCHAMSHDIISNKNAHLHPAYYNLLKIKYYMCLVASKADHAEE